MTCHCQGEPRTTVSSLDVPTFVDHCLIAPEWLYLQAKLASLIPFARVAELLGDILPADEGLNAETVRTRLGHVGRRLEDEKVRQWFHQPRHTAPEVLYRYPYYRRRHLDTALGLDCGYVRNRHPRPQQHFEVVAGGGRRMGPVAASRSCAARVLVLALRARGGRRRGRGRTPRHRPHRRRHGPACAPDPRCAAWRSRDRLVPHRDAVSGFDQTAKGLPEDTANMRGWVIETLERAKWHLWHGHRWRTDELLEDVHGWTQAKRAETPVVIRKRGPVL